MAGRDIGSSGDDHHAEMGPMTVESLHAQSADIIEVTRDNLRRATEGLPRAVRFALGYPLKIRSGALTMVLPDGRRLLFRGHEPGPSAELIVRDYRFARRLMFEGDLGFAEAFMRREWDSPDPAGLLYFFCINIEAIAHMPRHNPVARLLQHYRHWRNRNTKAQARRNIMAHYDLGNTFYRAWLDPSMTYSSAYFGAGAASLPEAQRAKYRLLADQLGLKPGDHVLEIGCGWGGFAEHAARLGIRVHGVTISPSQLAFGQERMRHQQLDHLAHLELCDYRDLDGKYDAIVSIEMFEAVGERFWQTYFDTVSARLKAGGRALIQSITIDEAVFERYRDSADFIREFIFPGGMLPSHERFSRCALRAGLTTRDRFHFGRDYAETLRRWNDAFQAQRETIAAQGFDERFRRLWQLYYVFCEVGFDEGQTDVVQFLLQKE